MEGVTGASLLQLAMLVLGETSWLRFSADRLNVASLLLLALAGCYVVAIASQVLRARRAGASLGELAAPLGIAFAAIGYSRLDANGIAPSLLVALVVAEMVCRMILQRARGETRTFVSWAHALPLAPLVAATLGIASANACAGPARCSRPASTRRTFAAGVHQMRTALTIFVRRAARRRIAGGKGRAPCSVTRLSSSSPSPCAPALAGLRHRSRPGSDQAPSPPRRPPRPSGARCRTCAARTAGAASRSVHRGRPGWSRAVPSLRAELG